MKILIKIVFGRGISIEFRILKEKCFRKLFYIIFFYYEELRFRLFSFYLTIGDCGFNVNSRECRVYLFSNRIRKISGSYL